MASLAIHPPVHLTLHPDEPIRTVDDALKVLLRHAHDPENRKTQRLIAALNHASSQEQADRSRSCFATGLGTRSCCWSRPRTAATSVD
jgi:hypothetical protein